MLYYGFILYYQTFFNSGIYQDVTPGVVTVVYCRYCMHKGISFYLVEPVLYPIHDPIRSLPYNQKYLFIYIIILEYLIVRIIPYCGPVPESAISPGVMEENSSISIIIRSSISGSCQGSRISPSRRGRQK